MKYSASFLGGNTYVFLQAVRVPESVARVLCYGDLRQVLDCDARDSQ